ncbi:MAG: AAA family ATPase [Armatimonadetes bacterium]|nr:AAA family ATPase [Armatimonadota bacterium]
MYMTLDLHTRELARERITRLFRFMAELHRGKTPPRTELKQYDWVLRFRSLPDDKSVKVGEPPTVSDDGEVVGGDDFILKLRRPANHPEGPAAKLFDQFLELWSTIERESEKVQLVLGEGILLWDAPSGLKNHPVVVQYLQLEFDPGIPEFTVRETEREPMIYSPLLRGCGVEELAISQTRMNLQKAGCHPLGGAETTAYLQSLGRDVFQGATVVENPTEKEQAGSAPLLLRSPVIYLAPRNLGFAEAIESFLEALPELEELPPSLVRIVGLDAPPPEVDEDWDLLMTMPSNPEQDRVARRLSETGAVLVQGPPGTGKTHTIANLVGHLLAQGKSILVTSHASKALRVVRDMVIPELRPLCVSVLEQESESKSQLEDAVKGIVARFTSSDIEELETRAETHKQRRTQLKNRLMELEEQLLEARRDEYHDITVAGLDTHPARAAREVAKGRGVHDWIPGPVTPGVGLPLSEEEVAELYELNREVPAELEQDLAGRLPSLEEVLSEVDFIELMDRRRMLQATNPTAGSEFWEHEGQTLEQLHQLIAVGQKAVNVIQGGREWALECMRVGKIGGAQRTTWEDLIRSIETSNEEVSSRLQEVLASGAAVECEMSLNEQIRVCDEIIEHLQAGRSIGFLELQFKRNWKPFLQSCRINGSSPQTLEDCKGLASYLRVKATRQALKTRWDRQMSPKGAPSFEELGDFPEDAAFQYVQPLWDALDWFDKVWQDCLGVFQAAGLNWEAMQERVAPDPSLYGEFFRIRETFRTYLEPAVNARKTLLELKAIEQKQKEQDRLLLSYTENDTGEILERLRLATATGDVEGYSRAWNWLVQLHRLRQPAQRRNELLARLEQDAPTWAVLVRDHEAPHDRAQVPGDPKRAWLQMQWDEELQRRARTQLDEVQEELHRVRHQLRLATAHYVENKTWANQLRRTGVRQQQALVGWLDLMRKIGTGKGKRAPRLKAMAREKLADCRDAVPVWIMPLSRVAESYTPGKQKFDIVILDEASQCEITGLIAFALGKQVLVVGDHEQVSPEAVGMSYDLIEGLIEQYLRDIPNKELYDGKTSVYDLARQSFGGTIRLLEHFRCVPEIIGFSNHLCYQGEIQPLREYSLVKLRPATVAHQVPDGEYKRRINQSEAEQIASLVASACEQPEYAGATMGVISLVGEEQALAVDRYLTQHIPLTHYQERRLICGNPAQFQGDERDVIFLSVVETAENGALTLRRTEAFTKRFNVAASRARNQMWVVHSLDPEQDLKEGDLRKLLIDHALHPEVTLKALEEMQPVQSSVDDEVDYRFENHLKRHLESAGYRVVTGWTVGNYRLDLVAEGSGGRVAIKCDGAREHPPDRFEQESHREAVLERLGWRFVRVRGSQYYLDPEGTCQMVVNRLRELSLGPWRQQAEEAGPEAHELLQRVIKRAEQIRRIWRGEVVDEPAPAPPPPEPEFELPPLSARPEPEEEEGWEQEPEPAYSAPMSYADLLAAGVDEEEEAPVKPMGFADLLAAAESDEEERPRGFADLLAAAEPEDEEETARPRGFADLLAAAEPEAKEETARPRGFADLLASAPESMEASGEETEPPQAQPPTAKQKPPSFADLLGGTATAPVKTGNVPERASPSFADLLSSGKTPAEPAQKKPGFADLLGGPKPRSVDRKSSYADLLGRDSGARGSEHAAGGAGDDRRDAPSKLAPAGEKRAPLPGPKKGSPLDRAGRLKSLLPWQKGVKKPEKGEPRRPFLPLKKDAEDEQDGN